MGFLLAGKYSTQKFKRYIRFTEKYRVKAKCVYEIVSNEPQDVY